MSSEYFIQINPVVATAACWGTERSSGGREKSLTFAAVIPHFIVGAQKKMVLGPAGWFQKAAADCMRPAIAPVTVVRGARETPSECFGRTTPRSWE